MGLSDYLNRKPAEEDGVDIPFGEDQTGSDLQDYLFQQGLFNSANQFVGKMSPGTRIQVSPSTQLPKPEQLQALMKLSGYDPQAAAAARSKEAGDLETIRKMVGITGEPQLNLAPAFNLLNAITGRNIAYSAPEPYENTIDRQAKISQMIGSIEAKKIEDAQKLAALVAKLSTKAPGMTISRALPQQNQFGSKIIPASEVSKLAEMKTGLGAIDDLITSIKENPDLVGPLQGTHYNIGVGRDSNIIGQGYAAIRALTDPKDARAQQLIQRRETVKQFVAKPLEGGVLRDADEKKYDAIVASIKRDSFVSEEQLKELKRLISNYMTIKQQTLGQAGYNVSGFDKAPAQKGYQPIPDKPSAIPPIPAQPKAAITSKDLFK